MEWIKPDFEEISLNMEVTAYVNTDQIVVGEQRSEKTDDHQFAEN